MPKNIEIKARIHDVEVIRARAAELATEPPRRLVQKDTFFSTGEGRLKLRQTDDGAAELIYYNRSDLIGPKCSTYYRAAVNDAGPIKELLEASAGLRGVVKKVREVFIAKDTRIHIDEVDGLGWFLELEVMLGEDDPEENGHARAHALMEALGIVEGDLVEGAYIDLLQG
jgi:predicted adenylyl cyclase CyaB